MSSREAMAWRDGTRRVLGTDATIANVPVAQRRRAAQKWIDRAKAELQAAGGFAIVTEAAFALQADPEVLALVAQGSYDELRHSQICLEAAVQYAGHELPRPALSAVTTPSYPGADEELTRHLHLVSLC